MPAGNDRKGMVLIIVTVVVVLICLAGLAYVATLHSERKTVHAEADRLRLEAAAGSGIEWLKAFFEQPALARQEAGGAWDNPSLFQGMLVAEDEAAGRRVRFSVVAPKDDEGEVTGLRFGTENESARLNLGAVVRWDAREAGAGRQALMSLPGMTESVADAILDWVDADSSPRPSGAEADYYEGLDVPYSPRNGVPQCLEELLLVRGVTRELLFGADADFNRRIDPEERKAAAARSEGSAGPQHVPWASLLTVASAERNESFEGQARVDVNDDDLARLEQRLGAALDARWARFIVAYRQFGPYVGERPGSQDASASIDPSKPAKVRIESLLGLIGARVLVPRGATADEKNDPILASPLANEPGALREHLPKLLDRATVVTATVVAGLVNVNLAPRAVLRAVPGMDSALVERVLASRGSRSSPDAPERRHATWLLTEGLVDLPQMNGLLRYLTCGGDVQRAQVIALFDEPGPSMRVEVVVDATARPPRQVYYKDLRPFGRGYPLEWLGAERSR